MVSRPTHTLLLIALGHLTIELCNNFLPIVYPLLISSLGLSYSQIGMIALVAGISTSLTQPLFGFLSDRWQPHLITIWSIAWSGMVMGLVGSSWNYLSLILIVGLGALGSAAFHPSGVTVTAILAHRRRGAAVSVFSVGGNLGTALSPLWVTAGINWLGLSGTSVLVPVGLGISLFLWRHLEPIQRPDGGKSLPQHETSRSWSHLGLVLIVAAMVFRSWFQSSFMTYLPSWIQDQGGSLSVGGQTLFVFLAAVGVGSLIGGTLSDRIGRWQVLVVSLSLLGPIEWAFISAAQPVQMMLLSLLGALLGSTFPVSIVLAQEVWPRGLGVASGLVIGLPWIGGGIGASLTGLLADRFSLTIGLQSLILPALLAAVSMAAYTVLQSPRGKAETMSRPQRQEGR